MKADDGRFRHEVAVVHRETEVGRILGDEMAVRQAAFLVGNDASDARCHVTASAVVTSTALGNEYLSVR